MLYHDEYVELCLVVFTIKVVVSFVSIDLPSFERQTFISIKLCSFIISIIGDIHKKLNSVEIQTYLGYAFIELDHEIPHADEENFLRKVRCKLSIESLIFYGLSLSF